MSKNENARDQSLTPDTFHQNLTTSDHIPKDLSNDDAYWSDLMEPLYESDDEIAGENTAIPANILQDKDYKTAQAPHPSQTPKWGIPQPITPKPAKQPYPVDVLPPILKNAVIEIAEQTQAPIAMVACSALATLSTAVQGHINVQRPGSRNLIGPTSLYFLTLADSGERKSTVDREFTEPIQVFEETAQREAATDLAEYQALHDVWQMELDAAVGKKTGEKNHGKK